MSAPVLFQFLPPLLPSEYQALTESIRTHGVQVPVLVDESGAIIDGHHRDQIAAELGIRCPREVRSGLTDTEKRSLAITLNRDRRHLTQEQKRALASESVKADPQLSDREHARRVGVSHVTVAKLREGLTQSGQIDHFSERIDPRTGKASQPAAKPKPVERIDPTTGEIVGGSTIATREGVVIAEQRQVQADRRPPLRNGFRDAALDLGKLVARFERLVADDRLARNKNEVARYANDLTRASEALQRLADQLTN